MAGTVIVWDTGAFANATEIDGDSVSTSQGLDDGDLVVDLHGEKLSGAFRADADEVERKIRPTGGSSRSMTPVPTDAANPRRHRTNPCSAAEATTDI